MSSFLSRIKIKTGLQTKKNKFDLSCTHITTQDFYDMKPVYIKEVIPGESVKINMQSFTRLSPMTQPMFGSVRQVNRAFFVPMRTIMAGWNNFIVGSPYTDVTGTGMIDSVCRFKLEHLYNILTLNKYSYSVASPQIAHDFVNPTQSGQNKWRCFTEKGKLIYNILQGLGYKLNWTLLGTSKSDSQVYVSALPLYAYAKIWLDWYQNPAYRLDNDIEALFKFNPNIEVSAVNIQSIFDSIINVCYTNDYFTAAWDNPVSPNSDNIESTIDIADNTVKEGASSRVNHVWTSIRDTQTETTTPVIAGGTGSSSGALTAPASISQFMLDALHSVTDYVKRHQMVGSRVLDRYMAQYGIGLTSAKLDRSDYLGKYDADVQISDVMSTSFNDLNEGLGDYAGKGIGYGNGEFKFEADEFGYIIITSYMEPKFGYVDGRPRNLQHITKFDFFTPDFDAMGVQSIRQDELIANGMITEIDSASTLDYKADGVFGYTPRYAEYKTAQDNVTGDFKLGSKNTSLEGWMMNRNYSLDDVVLDGLEVKHNKAFTIADSAEFNDIWQAQDSGQDHFFTVFRFGVDSYMPAKSLFDMYDYSNEDGKSATMHLNGIQVTD